MRVESKKNEKNTENVTGNRPNMDRKRCSERSTDDGDLEKKDEENVIIETTKVQCLESRMQTDIIATTHLTPRFFQPIQPSWPLRKPAPKPMPMPIPIPYIGIVVPTSIPIPRHTYICVSLDVYLHVYKDRDLQIGMYLHMLG